MRIGVVQMRSSDDPWGNLLQVDAFVREAATAGCRFVCFPENVFYRGARRGASGSERADAHLRLNADGTIDASFSSFSAALSEMAKEWSVCVSLGSVLESDPASELPFNSHWILEPGGRAARSYRKIHLFDFEGENAAYRESRDVAPGRDWEVSRVDDWKVGRSICYDLRFPELYRRLTIEGGSELLLIPAAFTLETGRAHWHTLLRARAIENLSFVVAAAQWGSHRNADGKELFCYGHALVYGPWGELLAEAPESGDALLVAELDRATLDTARHRLPALSGVRVL